MVFNYETDFRLFTPAESAFHDILRALELAAIFWVAKLLTPQEFVSFYEGTLSWSGQVSELLDGENQTYTDRVRTIKKFLEALQNGTDRTFTKGGCIRTSNNLSETKDFA